MFALGFIGVALLGTGIAPVTGALAYALVHASITTVAQPWCGLQFESLIVESNLLFALGYAFRAPVPWLWVYLLRWLVFRLMVAAGAGKLSSGDPAWRCRGPSAMSYHYLSQPLPNALSRFMHRLPEWWHRAETRACFLFEGPLCLTFFMASRAARWAGFAGTLGFNLAIALTGNYGHLHILTATDALAVLAEPPTWGPLGGTQCGSGWAATSCPAPAASLLGAAWRWALWVLGVSLGASYFLVSLVPFTSNFEGLVALRSDPPPGWGALERAFAVAQRWHAVGLYNLFATMTRFRWELVLEGTTDGGATWHAFSYWNKPGGPPATLDERPLTLPPGHFLRCDWRAWFLPLTAARLMRLGLDPSSVSGMGDGWWPRFARKVLECEPDVLALLRVPPALQGVPHLDAVRTLMYDYEFSNGHTSWAAQQQAREQVQRAGREAEAEAEGVRSKGTEDGKQKAQPEAPQIRRRARASAGSTGSDATAETAASARTVTMSVVRGSLPSTSTAEEGAWWKRRFVGLYDVQMRKGPRAGGSGDQGAPTHGAGADSRGGTGHTPHGGPDDADSAGNEPPGNILHVDDDDDDDDDNDEDEAEASSADEDGAEALADVLDALMRGE